MKISREIPAVATHQGIALAIGNFDGVHLGHQAILQQTVAAARQHGLTPAVLSFEPSPREFFSRLSRLSRLSTHLTAPLPAHLPIEAALRMPVPGRLSSLREKAIMFAHHGIEHFFALRFNEAFSCQSPAEFIAQLLALKVKWLMVGQDFHFGAKRAGNADMLYNAGQQAGFTVTTLADINIANKRVSSTAIRDALWAGDLNLATQMLGRPYSISGHVTHGRKLGRTLGFPTANVSLTRRRPALSGVFAVKCSLVSRGLEGVASKVWMGVANLGTNPAVQSNGKYSLEAFLFDFSPDVNSHTGELSEYLYGKRLEVEFVSKIRDEANFDTLDALIAQMHDDCARAKYVLKTC